MTSSGTLQQRLLPQNRVAARLAPEGMAVRCVFRPTVEEWRERFLLRHEHLLSLYEGLVSSIKLPDVDCQTFLRAVLGRMS